MARQTSEAGAQLTSYWRVPGTLGGVTALRAAPPPPPETGPAAEAGFELSVSLRSLAGEIERDRDWRERLAAAIMPIDVPAIGAFTAVQTPYIQGTWGPNTGYTWAVQRITVAPLLPNDVMQLYRGASTADASGNQNLLQGFQGSAGAVQAWTPGRTGCMLAAAQNIVITGTLSGGPYMLNADVIQVETWAVPYFLL